MYASTKTMICVASFFGLTLTASFAEGKGNEDWAEKAALGYEKKAAVAVASGNAEAAKIYTRMAQIKRDAGAAGKKGEEFSWKEYHELEGALNKMGNDKKHAGKPNQGFLAAAKGYEEKAKLAEANGNHQDALIYRKLANIKKEAAEAVSQGKGYDWSKYFELQKQLNQ